MAIIFFDFDGTLVDEKAEIYRPTQITIASIEKLRKNGHLAVLATGRAKSYIPDTGIKLDGIIASNGAYAEINGKVVYNYLVPDEYTREIVERADEMEYIYVLENQDICYTNGFYNDDFIHILEFFDISRTNFRPVSEAEKLRANKMFLTCKNEAAFKRLCEVFDGKFIFGMHRGGQSCDCDPVGNNKGRGIAAIAAAAGVDISETFAFGDSINDYEMLENVAHGIAMGDHRPELDAVCEFVTGTVSEEGVTTALEKLGLV
ncbi:MAG: HAD-IIB family hydrolase [Candidatus Ornithomonoglobus sp.]